MIKISKLKLVVVIMALSACVVSPGYYDAGPEPAPYYGYYGYEPVYPWGTSVGIDISNGYGHGGYYGRGGGYSMGRSFGGGRR